MPTVHRKIFLNETEEEIAKMTRQEVTLNLTEKEIKFCEGYTHNKNIKIAAIKAGANPNSAAVWAWKIRQKEDVNRYIAWLKLKVSREAHVNALQIIDMYARAAFSDMTDFIDVAYGKIKPKDLRLVDGQLIQSIKQGKDGSVSITLIDKMDALKKLEIFFDVMPKDWRASIEERKLELLEERLDLDKRRYGVVRDPVEDDGFLEALRGSCSEVWEGEEEEEYE